MDADLRRFQDLAWSGGSSGPLSLTLSRSFVAGEGMPVSLLTRRRPRAPWTPTMQILIWTMSQSGRRHL